MPDEFGWNMTRDKGYACLGMTQIALTSNLRWVLVETWPVVRAKHALPFLRKACSGIALAWPKKTLPQNQDGNAWKMCKHTNANKDTQCVFVSLQRYTQIHTHTHMHTTSDGYTVIFTHTKRYIINYIAKHTYNSVPDKFGWNMTADKGYTCLGMTQIAFTWNLRWVPVETWPQIRAMHA